MSLNSYLYEKMPATPFVLAAPLASAFLPTGPAAIETLPPRVKLPAEEKVLTAAVSFKIMTKSVNSAPIWPPNPALYIVENIKKSIVSQFEPYSTIHR